MSSANETGGGALLIVDDLHVHFPIGGGQVVRAVDGVSFTVGRSETLGVVGESGCGKTTTGRAVLRLVEATRGRVAFDGQDVFALDAGKLRQLRQRMQIVFQDPFASLSPRLTVGAIVAEPLEIHNVGTVGEQHAKVADLLAAVGVPADAALRYPHEFSGGQRQRIGIARALALNPDLIVLDEPVSALDISVRAQVVNLLSDLQQDRGLSYLFIGHDLSLIRRVAHRVAVMYLGRIVEIADSETLYRDPRHPYTRSLFASAPVADPMRIRNPKPPLEGDPPSPVNLPSGCRFRTRCPFAQEICAREDPPFVALEATESRMDGDPARTATPPRHHSSACHFARELPVWDGEAAM